MDRNAMDPGRDTCLFRPAPERLKSIPGLPGANGCQHSPEYAKCADARSAQFAQPPAITEKGPHTGSSAHPSLNFRK